ncbi:P2Y purinoceptor 14-like [Pseudochaenichthys georgianus]|uniref:P2Y purinoceptor 14-like n=1 Tax=Pseudochaenichthys georgianus TaxID=52239 RepID=UPI00146C0184|nr:P2Y purinoceptor 14-like [Pseudochaenichthys georgianus]
MDHQNTSHVPTNQSDYSSIFPRQCCGGVVLPSLYILTFVVGLALNGVAACIFFRVPSDSGLVVYLKNMVVADLLMLFTFPFKVAADLGLGGWQMNVFWKSRWCRVSMLLLLQRVGFAQGLALFTWSFLFLCLLPNVVLTSKPAKETHLRLCVELKTLLGQQWHDFSVFFNNALFWLTLSLLFFCYTSIACHLYRSYRRVRRDESDICRKSKRSIFSILLVFFVCFMPHHVVLLLYTLCENCKGFLMEQLKEATLFLSAINVCLDPVIYFLMCRTFRESLIRKLSGRRGRRERWEVSHTTGQSVTYLGGGQEVRKGGEETNEEG